MLKQIKNEMENLANPRKARILSRFFKTGRGQYGEGDLFLGITVPQTRAVARKFREAEMDVIKGLLSSKIHEHRLLGLLILVERFGRAGKEEQQKIYRFYLGNTAMINNWDLVDLSAPKIIGEWLVDNEQDREILEKLARSKDLWNRRIAIVSTYALIRKNQFRETLDISKMLLNDKHDLIHKAVGWMLREVWKMDSGTAEEFLKKHAAIMPRTMLRYAIERMDDGKRKQFLRK